MMQQTWIEMFKPATVRNPQKTGVREKSSRVCLDRQRLSRFPELGAFSLKDVRTAERKNPVTLRPVIAA